MRLLLLILTLGTLLPLAVAYPHAGLLLWGWLTFMQPHQEAWDVPPWLELNLITAVVTIVCWLFSREPKLPNVAPLPILILLFCSWMLLSQLYSLRPEHSWVYLDRGLRVMAFVCLSLVLLTKATRIHAMVWALVISIGYHAVLGGSFTAATGGEYLVLGPPGSMIHDNNDLGLAIATTLPLMIYLYQQSHSRLVRISLIAGSTLSVVGLIGTHSRGAFIAFMVMCFLLVLRMRSGTILILVILTIGAGAIASMPVSWHQRMETIITFKEDASFQGRVDAWANAWDVATARPLVGAGLRVPYIQDAIAPFLAEPRRARAAHSIYFEVLGSMGFIALAIFLAILSVTWRDFRWIDKNARGRPELQWALDLASMAQLSFFTFLVGGAALSMEFWEGFWLLVVLAFTVRASVEHVLASGPHQLSTGPHSSGLRIGRRGQ